MANINQRDSEASPRRTQVSVIIVNWNAQADLLNCLASLDRSRSEIVQFDVWVVDNASKDGSVQAVKTQYPNVNVIANAINLGFSAANNQAITQSNSDYVFLLNSDAYVHAGCLTALLSFATSNTRAAIIGPKVLNTNNTIQQSCRRFPTLGAGFFRNTLLGSLFPKNKYAYEYLMGDFMHDVVREVDWISGCAMWMRRDFLTSHGTLDERFFMYCEDVDICNRAWKSGSAVMYVPTGTVTHAIGRSSDKNAEQMIKEFHRSWYLYDLKTHPNALVLRRVAVYLGLQLRAWVRIFRRYLARRRVKGGVDK